MTSRPWSGRTRSGLLKTMFSASSALTWSGVALPDSRSLRKGCIVISPTAFVEGESSGVCPNRLALVVEKEDVHGGELGVHRARMNHLSGVHSLVPTLSCQVRRTLELSCEDPHAGFVSLNSLLDSPSLHVNPLSARDPRCLLGVCADSWVASCISRRDRSRRSLLSTSTRPPITSSSC